MSKIETTGEINIADFLKLLIKNIFSIFYFTIVGLILGLIYVNSIMTPQYTATGTVTMKSTTNTTVLNTITEIAKSTNVAELALLSLEEDGVVLDSGVDITVDYIRTRVSATYISTSLNVTISFVSDEQESSISILNAVIDATKDYGNENYLAINGLLMVGEYATSAPYTGQSKMIILTFSLIIGCALGTLIGLASDVIGGKILFETDIKRLGLPTNRLIYDNKDRFDISKLHILQFQNSLENSFVETPLKLIGFVAIDKKNFLDYTLKSLSYQYAENNYKTLILDLDFENPTLDKNFGYSSETSINNLIESKYFQKPVYKKIADNLFLLSSQKNLYPARLLKNPNFEKIIALFKEDFDIIIMKFSNVQDNNSSFVASTFLDCLVVNVQIDQSKKRELVDYINGLLNYDFNRIFVNLLDKKNDFPRLLKKVFKKNVS